VSELSTLLKAIGTAKAGSVIDPAPPPTVPGPMVVRIVEGYASDLQNELNMLVSSGHVLRFITPNGVNRWSVVAEKTDSGGLESL
jgi:hypothetical protein